MYKELVIEAPTVDLWQRSLKEIMELIPGDHTGLKPVAVQLKYFFDYSFYDNDELEKLANQVSSSRVKAQIHNDMDIPYNAQGSYHWRSKDLKALERKVTKVLGKNFVQYIEPKMVVVCEVAGDYIETELFGAV